MKNVDVVGCGFAGLVTAWALQKRGHQVVVYEAKSEPGGMIQSLKHGGHTFECAANGLLNSPDIEDLMQDLNLKWVRPRGAACRRYIYWQRPRRWPLSFGGTIVAVKGFFKAKSNGRLMPLESETVAEWSRRVLGKEATERLVSPALQGIYASTAEQLSALSLLEKFFNPKVAQRRPKSAKGSVFPKDGMSAMLSELKRVLEGKGVQFRFASQIDEVDTSRYTVIATNAPKAAQILAKSHPSLSRQIGNIQMLPLASVEVLSKQTLINGFGVLFPELSSFHSMGMLQDSVLFPWRHSSPCERWIIGGTRLPNLPSLSDDQLISLVLQDRTRLGAKSAPDAVVVSRWNQALPHYSLQHREIVRDLELPERIELNGNYISGIGLSQIAARAVAIAEKWS